MLHSHHIFSRASAVGSATHATTKPQKISPKLLTLARWLYVGVRRENIHAEGVRVACLEVKQM